MIDARGFECSGFRRLLGLIDLHDHGPDRPSFERLASSSGSGVFASMRCHRGAEQLTRQGGGQPDDVLRGAVHALNIRLQEGVGDRKATGMGEDLPSGDDLVDDPLRDPAEPDRGAVDPLPRRPVAVWVTTTAVTHTAGPSA